MGRIKINEEAMTARFPAGTLKRLDRVLDKGEPKAEFVREAVSRELRNRERVLTRQRLVKEEA